MKLSLNLAGQPARRVLCLVFAAWMGVSACSNEADDNDSPVAGTQAGSGMAAAGMGAGAGASRAVAVVAEPIKLSNFVDETEALGTAKSNEAVDITAKSTNRVVAVHFREEIGRAHV